MKGASTMIFWQKIAYSACVTSSEAANRASSDPAEDAIRSTRSSMERRVWENSRSKSRWYLTRISKSDRKTPTRQAATMTEAHPATMRKVLLKGPLISTRVDPFIAERPFGSPKPYPGKV